MSYSALLAYDDPDVGPEAAVPSMSHETSLPYAMQTILTSTGWHGELGGLGGGEGGGLGGGGDDGGATVTVTVALAFSWVDEVIVSSDVTAAPNSNT